MGLEKLERFDQELFSAPSLDPKRQAKIHNGIYTLTLPDGTHRTFKISTKKATAKFAAGKRIVYLLTGPDNTTDYEAFGFVDDAGISVWRKKRGEKEPSRSEEYAELLWDLATGGEVEGCQLMLAATCLRCNRLLTDPLSLTLGLGETCRSILSK